MSQGSRLLDSMSVSSVMVSIGSNTALNGASVGLVANDFEHIFVVTTRNTDVNLEGTVMMTACTILRNPVEENERMHALNGNGPQHTPSAKAKAAKGPSPISVKIKVIAILECHQYPNAERVYDAPHQKSNEKMTRIATRPSHLVPKEIKERQAETTENTHTHTSEQ